MNAYFKQTMNADSANKTNAADNKGKKKRKGPMMQDFHLYDRDRLEELATRERELAQQRENHLAMISELRKQISKAPPSCVGQMMAEVNEMDSLAMLNQFALTAPEQAEKAKLLSEGFPNWSRKEYKLFCSSLEANGRYAITKIIDEVAQATGKTEDEIKKYYVAFWLHYRRIADWNKIIDKIEKGERKIHRLRDIRDIIRYKVEKLHLVSFYNKMNRSGAEEGKLAQEVLKKYHPWDLLIRSWDKMEFKYGAKQRGFSNQREEDAFLLAMMYRHGFGAARRIQLEIRRAWQFRFNWFFKSRSPQEIQKRCDSLIRVVEREVHEHCDEVAAKEEQDQHQSGQPQEKVVEEQTPMQAPAKEPLLAPESII